MELEVNNVLRKVATAIRTLGQFKSSRTITYRVTILKSLVLSQLVYTLPVLVGVRENALNILDRQMNWPVKTAFLKIKYENLLSLKTKQKVHPIRPRVRYYAII